MLAIDSSQTDGLRRRDEDRQSEIILNKTILKLEWSDHNEFKRLFMNTQIVNYQDKYYFN